MSRVLRDQMRRDLTKIKVKVIIEGAEKSEMLIASTHRPYNFVDDPPPPPLKVCQPTRRRHCTHK